MYVPQSFHVKDAEKLSAFLHTYSFATLVTCSSGIPFASHLPIRHRFESGRIVSLTSHLARANPQWKHFEANTEVLAIFQGPHAYISPSWYAVEPAVPTWNYATVHVYGYPKLIEDHDQIVKLLGETVAQYESGLEHPWNGALPEDYRDRLIGGLVAFEIEVTRVEGKFKLGQNRDQQDIDGVYQHLSTSENVGDRKLAELMLTSDRPPTINRT